MDLKNMKEKIFRENGILAWIVCLGMLFSNIIVQGINNTFGELIGTIIEEFNSDLTSVSLIPSVHSAAYYLAGFICSILVKWYSFRSLVFLGGAVSGMAFIASFYASSITSLTITYGLVGGMANGIVYVPGLIACGFYFDDQKRALATGIATSGSGVGIVVIPLPVGYINECLGWRYSMLFLGVISPIICLVALIMLPLPPVGGADDNQNIVNLECGDDEKKNIQFYHSEQVDLKAAKKMSICEMKFGLDLPIVIQEIKRYLSDSWCLLKQPKLIMYCLSHGSFTLAYFIPIDFLSTMMAEDHGISVEEASYIIPIIGVSTCLGKLVTGLLISKYKMNSLRLHAVYLAGSGFCCFGFTLCTQYYHYIGFAIFYGFVVGPIDTLIVECLSTMFGLELVKDTVGFVMLVYAMGAAIGAPIGGWIYAATDDFNAVFHFCAGVYILGGMSGWFALLLNKKYEQITSQYDRI